MKSNLGIHITSIFVSVLLLAGGVMSFSWLKDTITVLREETGTAFQDLLRLETKQLRSNSLSALAEATEKQREELTYLFLDREAVPEFLEELEAIQALQQAQSRIVNLEEKEQEIRMHVEGQGGLFVVLQALDALSYLPRASYISRYSIQKDPRGTAWHYRAVVVILLATDMD